MIDELSVANAFFHADRHFEDLVESEHERGESEMGAVFSDLRKVNAAAYFMLLFSQFEDRVNQLCRDLIRRRKGAASWEERRVWDILDESGDRIRTIPFMNRAALLTEKGANTYNKIKELHDIRNHLAHGRPLLQEEDFALRVKEIQDIARQMSGTP